MTLRTKPGHRRAAFGALLGVAISLACSAPPAPPPTEVVAVRQSALAADPADAAWRAVPAYSAALLPQDVVEPRLLELGVRTVAVRAMHDGARLAVWLQWQDATENSLPGAAAFEDACAIQLPQTAGPDAPDPQMGDAAKPVEITFWRALRTATGTDRAASIRDLYPNASVDHYPFEAASLTSGSAEQQAMALRYAPARAVGNDLSPASGNAVQDLIAAGPGTLTAAPERRSEGRARRTADGWEVVFVRPLPQGVRPGNRTVIALAVWDGARQNVGSRKMRSVWIPLLVE